MFLLISRMTRMQMNNSVDSQKTFEAGVDVFEDGEGLGTISCPRSSV